MMASKAARIYTGLAGLPACKEPQKELVKYYSKLIRHLGKLPKESQYRVATEELINNKLEIAKTSSSPEEAESKLGNRPCEQLVEEVKLELNLIEKMLEHKPWEPLMEKPPQDQWRWPL